MTRQEWSARVVLVDPTGRMLYTVDSKKGHTKVLGGGGESGETFEQAAAREVYEESGNRVNLNESELVYLDTQSPDEGYGPALAHWFMAVVDSSTLDSLDGKEGGYDVRSMFVNRVENAKKLLGHDNWKRFFHDRLEDKIFQHIGM